MSLRPHGLPDRHPSLADPPTRDPPAPIKLDGVSKMALETGRTRLLVAGFVFALAFLAIGLRLVELGALHPAEEPQVADSETAEPFNAGRADIVDRNGVVLATTLPTQSLYADPHQVRNVEETAVALAGVLPELSPDELVSQLSLDRSFVWIKRDLTPRQQYEVNRLGLPGLHFQREMDRVYPLGPLTAQIVGFTDVDGNGLAGLERAFDTRLRSQDEPLRLSVDVRVQYVLAEEIAAAMAEFRAIGGAGVVVDVDSGEVIAMVSLPTFDPDQPGAAPAEDRFNRVTLRVQDLHHRDGAGRGRRRSERRLRRAQAHHGRPLRDPRFQAEEPLAVDSGDIHLFQQHRHRPHGHGRRHRGTAALSRQHRPDPSGPHRTARGR